MSCWRDVLLHLSLIPRIGPATVAQIVQRVGFEELETLYGMGAEKLGSRLALSPALAQALAKGLGDKKLLEDEQHAIARAGAFWITRYDDAYPSLLAHIHAPPTILYFQTAPDPGVAPAEHFRRLCEQTVAVVGSRQADAYGQRVVRRLVSVWASAGYTIISGGALGADTYAHREALEVGGLTVAVVGSGLLHPYPASNKRLFEAIAAAGGAVVTPFSMQTTPLPGNFPARNRIIAGLAQATIVIQAAEQSGARITALQALEQGREVGAVPGQIDNPLSAGCHRLLTEGASVIQAPEDLYALLGETSVHAPVKVEGATSFEKTSQTPSEAQTVSDPLLVGCSEPRTLEELSELLSEDESTLYDRLFILQCDGKVQQDFLGRWQALR